MKRIILLFVLILIFQSEVCNQTTIVFQHKKHEKRLKKMKFKGIEYLEFRTKDSTLYAQYVLNVSDSLQFCADGNKVEFTIPLSKIISIKKYNSFVEGTGYIILGMAMVIAVVYTPIALISDSKKGGRDALEGALGVSAISMPLIVIGSIISKLKLKNWKITRIDGGKTNQ